MAARSSLRFRFILVVAVALPAYLLLWPTPIEPVAWDAPPNPGYVGPFQENGALTGLKTLDLGEFEGPEDVALDATGRIYAAMKGGAILRLTPEGTDPKVWARTDGRPLGLEFDASGNLIVADALKGLLSIAEDGQVSVLAREADGIPIDYADDLDIGADGRIYFSDASTKFSAIRFGGPYPASLLDMNEHGGHGRLLEYDPATQQTRTLLSGLQFANGVAIDPDQRFVVVAETGMYRVIKYHLTGPKKGMSEPLAGPFPGFPDNVSVGRGGRFWIGLVSPRSAALDAMSATPILRKIAQRLPPFMRPKARAYGHVIAIDSDGEVLASLQDPTGGFAYTTGVVETQRGLLVTSLSMHAVGILKPEQSGESVVP